MNIKVLKIYLLGFLFVFALSAWAWAGINDANIDTITGSADSSANSRATAIGNANYNANIAAQHQGQGQAQAATVTYAPTEISRSYTLPYQLYPPNLAPDFGNGNTYGNFVKVPSAFLLRHRFTRCELETMRPTHGLFGDNSGVKVKFRSWCGPRADVKQSTDYVDFVWELPKKQVFGADGRPKLDEKGQPVMAAYTPDTWVLWEPEPPT